MDGLSQLLATADELYGLLPEAFVAARDERVRGLRRDGQRARALAVKDLRRPSVAAWLVNALVRHRRGEVEQLLALGTALRQAQQSLDAAQLRELNRQRQAVLAAIGREARRLAQELGRPVSEQVAEEVEETLRAALADPAAANAVRSGRLTTALSYVGFGEADLAEAVAVPEGGTLTGLPAPGVHPDDTRGRPQRAAAASGAEQDRERQARDRAAREAQVRRESARREALTAVRAAEDAARHAEGAALVAEQHRDGVIRRETSARQRLDHFHDRVAELESQLAAARQQASAAAAGWAPLHAEAEAASARARAARGLADRTRATLQAARAHLGDVERAEDLDRAGDLGRTGDVEPAGDTAAAPSPGGSAARHTR
jgi:hypothetical protein